MIESPVERLMKVHPDLEVWWDSSPWSTTSGAEGVDFRRSE